MKSRRQPPPDEKLAQEELAAALLSLGDGFIVTGSRWDHGGLKVLFANPAFGAMTGYAPGKLTGQNTRRLNGPKSDAARLQRWLRTVRHGRVHHGEGFLYRKDGSVFYAVWSYSPVGEGTGRPERLVAVYRDMTEMRRLQDTLVHSQRLDAVGQLAGGVAHDFNNLLSVINGYCDILNERLAIDPVARRNLEEIHTAGRKAVALTRQLLAFSRRQEMAPKVINLNHVLDELREFLRRLAGPATTLTFELAPDLGNAHADPAQLQQVILNLVINARDALPAIGGVITIRTAGATLPADAPGTAGLDLPAGRYVRLTVQDNGAGMDADTLSHLFEPFFTTKDLGKGTGLGLSTVYGIVKQSRGSVTAQSDLRVGSTFSVYLPEVSKPVNPRESSLPLPPDTRGRETILLMEEDRLVGKMVAGILTADGYKVLAASQPADALALAKGHARSIELLITDLTDARGRGRELAHELQVLKPGFRILCASTVGEAQPVPWLPAAYQAHIVKPFTLNELLRKTRGLLDAKAPVRTPGGTA
jgi:two-component system, cell cycle sensor histidine kinase and response regulator CckA